MIKEFLKWLELVPLLNCSSEGDAYAFLNRMFNRFGVNQGTKLCGDFQELQCNPKILDGFNYGSKNENNKGKGVGACSQLVALQG
jgi:hypothetical protein